MANPPSFFLWIELLIAENLFPVKGKKQALIAENGLHFETRNPDFVWKIYGP
jgi:hypothetical protein